MKETHYFSHDANARHDPKIIAMMSEFGAAGYGWFWIVIETLREQQDFRLQCKKYIWNALAMQMQCNAEQAECYIKTCISDYELFQTDEEFFWSNSLKSRMEKKDETSKKRSQAAQKRWSDANAMQNTNVALQIDASKVKESKVKNKEKVEKETSPPKNLSELCDPYRGKYGDKMVNGFLSYWEETSPGTKKQRWQQQDFFDPGRRLATWHSRDKSGPDNSSSTGYVRPKPWTPPAQ